MSALIFASLIFGMVGAAFYDLLRGLLSLACRLVDQRRREREFFADLADIPTGDSWHG